MKLFTFFSTLLFLSFASSLSATTYATIADGDWTSPSTWQDGNIPNATINGHNVSISHTVTYTVNDLKIKNGTNFYINSGGSLTVNGTLKIISDHYGDFHVLDGATLAATTFKHLSSSSTPKFNGTISGNKLETKGPMTIKGNLAFTNIVFKNQSDIYVYAGASITATDMEVNDSDFDVDGTSDNMVTLNLSGELVLKNYSNFDLDYTDFDANEVDSEGHYSYITGGTFDVATIMDLTNGSYMEFYETAAEIQGTLDLNAQSNIILKGRATLSGGTLVLTNSSNVFGRGEAGILDFSNPILNSSSCVLCIESDICYYGQGETPPGGLDLKTGTSGALLPVELIYFIAENNEPNIDLKWATATEKDNDYFQIEQSRDGYTWNAIAEVSGRGDSQTETSYAYTDKRNYNSGNVYYRLLQVDFDGTSTYSDIVVVEVKSDKEVSEDSPVEVFPNPATDVVNVIIPAIEGTPGFYLTNLVGQQLSLSFTATGNGYRLNIPNGLASGTYFMTIKMGEYQSTQKLMIQ